MKKKSNKIDVPVLKDVVQPGKELPKNEMEQLPPALSEIQLQSLNRQIEKIVQTHLQAVFKEMSQKLTNDIKAHLDKQIPELAKLALQQIEKE